MNIVTITLQKRIMTGAFKTAQFALIFVRNRAHALSTGRRKGRLFPPGICNFQQKKIVFLILRGKKFHHFQPP